MIGNLKRESERDECNIVYIVIGHLRKDVKREFCVLKCEYINNLID